MNDNSEPNSNSSGGSHSGASSRKRKGLHSQSDVASSSDAGFDFPPSKHLKYTIAVAEFALENLSESNQSKTCADTNSKDLESTFTCDLPPTQDHSAIDTSNTDFSSEGFTDTPVVDARMNILDCCLNNDSSIQMDSQDFVTFDSNSRNNATYGNFEEENSDPVSVNHMDDFITTMATCQDLSASAAFENEDIEGEISSSDYHAGFDDSSFSGDDAGLANPSDYSPEAVDGENRRKYGQYTEAINIDPLNNDVASVASLPMIGATSGYLPNSSRASPKQAVDNEDHVFNCTPSGTTFPPNSNFLPSEEGVEFATTERPASYIQNFFETNHGSMDYLSDPVYPSEAISTVDEELEENDPTLRGEPRSLPNRAVDNEEHVFNRAPAGTTFPPNSDFPPSEEGVEFATNERSTSHVQNFFETDGSMDYLSDPVYPIEAITTVDKELEENDPTPRGEPRSLPNRAVNNEEHVFNRVPPGANFPPNSDFPPSEEGVKFAANANERSTSHVQNFFETDRGPMDYLSDPIYPSEAISTVDKELEENDPTLGGELRSLPSRAVDNEEHVFNRAPPGTTFPHNSDFLASEEGVEFATNERSTSHVQNLFETDHGSMDFLSNPAPPRQAISTFDDEPEENDPTFGGEPQSLPNQADHAFNCAPSGTTFPPNSVFLSSEEGVEFATNERSTSHVQGFFETDHDSMDYLSDPASPREAISTFGHEPEEHELSSTYCDGIEDAPHAMFFPNNGLPTTSEGTEFTAVELIQTVYPGLPSPVHGFSHAPRSTFDCSGAGERELSGCLHGSIGDTPDPEDGMMECYSDQSDHVMPENQDWYSAGQSDRTMLEDSPYKREEFGEVDSFLEDANYCSYTESHEGDDELIDAHLFDVPLPENISPCITHIHTPDIPYPAAVPDEDNQDQWDGHPSIFHVDLPTGEVGVDMSIHDDIEVESHGIGDSRY
ncbi:hypothetical protein LENED_012013 [Lentinula edodes]|uniref:Uncharacterized protein n=1 Tax=Lentinula edodes TaxID=5353 RepID=A0A1Q3ERJ5_LENED|nr:hypothetical protein LENED_012013 [Lentinula edodes]